MSTRRSVGGYEWSNELDSIKGLGERMTRELAEIGKYAATVEASRRITELVSMSSQVSIKALELKDYQVREQKRTGDRE